MTGSADGRNPFDERAALAELERFRRDIERYRAQRTAAGHAFEKFIEPFPVPEEMFPAEAAAAASVPEPKNAPPGELSLPPLPKREVTAPRAAAPPRPVPEIAPVPVASHSFPPAIPAGAGNEPRTRRTTVLAAAILILVAVGALVVWQYGRARTPRSAQTTPAPASAPEPIPQPAVPPPAPAAAPAESEITTARRAWVRVIADGERVVERELPADSRITFKADKTIVIRTGDAGAVTLSIRGEEQGALGRDGQVVTRTFTLPGGPPR